MSEFAPLDPSQCDTPPTGHITAERHARLYWAASTLFRRSRTGRDECAQVAALILKTSQPSSAAFLLALKLAEEINDE